MPRKQKSLETLQAQCDQFNKENGIGARVKVITDTGDLIDTTIQYSAKVVGNTAVVWLVGVRACYALDRVVPV